MGTKMPPAYANIFMGNLEQQLLKGGDKILLWKTIFSSYGRAHKLNLNSIWTLLTPSTKPLSSLTNAVIKRLLLDVTLYKGSRFLQNGILDVKTHIKPTQNRQIYYAG